MPEVRIEQSAKLPTARRRRKGQKLFWVSPVPMQAVFPTFFGANLEPPSCKVCALSQMPAFRVEHMVGAVLRAAPQHAAVFAHGRHAIPLRVLPLQFRQLPALQGEILMAQETASHRGR